MVSSSLPGRAPTFFLSALIMFVSGCSRPAGDRPPASEAVGSADTANPADSTRSAALGSGPDSSIQSASVAAADTPRRVKPSIDPGRKQTTSQPPAPSADAGMKTASQSQYLKYDASSNTVTFELIGGPTGFQFNGYSSGGATLTLPSKANVVMNFINKDGTPHSAQVISGEGPLPNAAVDAALPRAYTNQLLQGLPQEGSDVMRFTVPESGTYRIFCGVPGHGLSGMWIWMKVDPAAKAPSFGPTK
jgi:hypothetical protein